MMAMAVKRALLTVSAAAFYCASAALIYFAAEGAAPYLFKSGNAVLTQLQTIGTFIASAAVFTTAFFSFWSGFCVSPQAAKHFWALALLPACKAAVVLPLFAAAALFAVKLMLIPLCVTAALFYLASVLFTAAPALAALEGRAFFECVFLSVRAVKEKGFVKVLVMRLIWTAAQLYLLAAFAALTRLFFNPAWLSGGWLSFFPGLGGIIEPASRLIVAAGAGLALRPVFAHVNARISAVACGVEAGASLLAFITDFVIVGGFAGALCALAVSRVPPEALAIAWAVMTLALAALYAALFKFVTGRATPGGAIIKKLYS